MNGEVEMLRIFPATIEQSDDCSKHRQQREDHFWHRLHDAALETARIDNGPTQEWLHHRWRSCDVIQRGLYFRRFQRLLVFQRSAGRVRNPLRPRLRPTRIGSRRTNVHAKKQGLARVKSEIGRGGGEKEVD